MFLENDQAADFLHLQIEMTLSNDAFRKLFRITIVIDMFEVPDFSNHLVKKLFNFWLEKGGLSKIGYHYLLAVWGEYESEYQPIYAEYRGEI